MFLSRLSLAALILLIVITACTQPDATRQVDVDSEPARAPIPQRPYPFPARTEAPLAQEPYPVPPTREAIHSREPYPISTENNALEQTSSGVDSTSEPDSPPEEAAAAGASPMPSSSATQISAWEGPGIVYLRYFREDLGHTGEIVISNLDGSRKSVTQTVSEYINPEYADYSPQTGRIVYTREDSLWVIDNGIEHRSILTSTDELIESPAISIDGTRIAYSLLYGSDRGPIGQLWTINADGTGNKLLFDDTGQYVPGYGYFPFYLIPVAWSLDNTKIYLVTTFFGEAIPEGIYVADLESGTIQEALAPQITYWEVPFSPDRTKIAYLHFQWVPNQGGGLPVAGPPFSLQVTDLSTGGTTVLQESNTFEFYHPVWSPDGSRIAYRRLDGEIGLYIIHLASGAVNRLVPGSQGSELQPWAWLGADRLVYTEVIPSSGDTSSASVTLYTIKIDGSEKHAIDSAGFVLGIVDGQN